MIKLPLHLTLYTCGEDVIHTSNVSSDPEPGGREVKHYEPLSHLFAATSSWCFTDRTRSWGSCWTNTAKNSSLQVALHVSCLRMVCYFSLVCTGAVGRREGVSYCDEVFPYSFWTGYLLMYLFLDLNTFNNSSSKYIYLLKYLFIVELSINSWFIP